MPRVGLARWSPAPVSLIQRFRNLHSKETDAVGVRGIVGRRCDAVRSIRWAIRSETPTTRSVKPPRSRRRRSSGCPRGDGRSRVQALDRHSSSSSSSSSVTLRLRWSWWHRTRWRRRRSSVDIGGLQPPPLLPGGQGLAVAEEAVPQDAAGVDRRRLRRYREEPEGSQQDDRPDREARGPRGPELRPDGVTAVAGGATLQGGRAPEEERQHRGFHQQLVRGDLRDGSRPRTPRRHQGRLAGAVADLLQKGIPQSQDGSRHDRPEARAPSRPAGVEAVAPKPRR
mmetsp:Transcript_10109/g.24526  ORF Transcript_10109/g.24526 Transcript_10109/m.24526 type:complete len:283 (-) Transcript_10109:139-987(-)